MKHFRRLLPALCLLLISAMCAGTSTYAWFSINNTVTATGVKIKAQASGSLVISTSPLTTGTDTKTIDFGKSEATAEADKLYPCTYDETAKKFYKLSQSAAEKISSSFGLITKGEKVSGSDLVEVEDSEKTGYIAEYSMYVGAQGKEVDNVSLSISISSGSSKVQGALCAVIEYTLTGQETQYAVGEYGTATINFTAPVIGAGESGVAITIKLYYDGNMYDTGNQTTIVRSNNMDADDAGDLTITFSFSGDN